MVALFGLLVCYSFNASAAWYFAGFACIVMQGLLKARHE